MISESPRPWFTQEAVLQGAGPCSVTRKYCKFHREKQTTSGEKQGRHDLPSHPNSGSGPYQKDENGSYSDIPTSTSGNIKIFGIDVNSQKGPYIFGHSATK